MVFLQRKRESRIQEQLAQEEVESSSDDETIEHVKKWKREEQHGILTPEDVETPEQKKERLAHSFLKELKEQSKWKIIIFTLYIFTSKYLYVLSLLMFL